jgi:hypothetical protein
VRGHSELGQTVLPFPNGLSCQVAQGAAEAAVPVDLPGDDHLPSIGAAFLAQNARSCPEKL